MDSSNNKVSNILNANNWSDALLVKDEKGNLTYLKPDKNKNSVDIVSEIKHNSEGNIAPQDDSFRAVENISGSSQDKAEFIFHPDDKGELDFFAKNMPQDDSKKYSIEKIVDRIIEKQNLILDAKNKKIFSNILYNFFRNRKSTIITRELLTNGVLIKNKKLSSITIDTILSIIKSIKNKIDINGGLVVNKVELKEKIEISKAKDESLSAQDEVKAALGGFPIPQEKIEKEKVPTHQVATATVSNKTEVINVKEDALEEKLKKSKAVKESKIEAKETKPAEGFSIPSLAKEIAENKVEIKPKLDIKEEEQPKIEEEVKTSLPKVSRVGTNQTPKKSISDVTTPVKEDMKPLLKKSVLTGPVQELQSFDLVGFRRLGNTAEERVQKILDKINLLEQESYTKKAQGIAAWRDSVAYKLYLQLGAESMTAGKEVADFIADKESKNKEVLSIEEFSAVSDLNKQLRF